MSRRFCKAEDLEDDASSRRIIVIDLNIPHPSTQEVEAKNENNVLESPNNEADGASPVIDWSSGGSVDIADDGRLRYVERERSPWSEGLELASALAEAETMEDAPQRSIIPDLNELDVDLDDMDGGEDGFDLWAYYK